MFNSSFVLNKIYCVFYEPDFSTTMKLSLRRTLVRFVLYSAKKPGCKI